MLTVHRPSQGYNSFEETGFPGHDDSLSPAQRLYPIRHDSSEVLCFGYRLVSATTVTHILCTLKSESQNGTAKSTD